MNNVLEAPDELMTIDEICQMLKCKRTAFWKIRKEKLIQPDLLVGQDPRYLKSTIINALKPKK